MRNLQRRQTELTKVCVVEDEVGDGLSTCEVEGASGKKVDDGRSWLKEG